MWYPLDLLRCTKHTMSYLSRKISLMYSDGTVTKPNDIMCHVNLLFEEAIFEAELFSTANNVFGGVTPGH
jgi:hypothetical protein